MLTQITARLARCLLSFLHGFCSRGVIWGPTPAVGTCSAKVEIFLGWCYHPVSLGRTTPLLSVRRLGCGIVALHPAGIPLPPHCGLERTELRSARRHILKSPC